MTAISLGEFEQQLLLGLLRLDGEAYGVPLRAVLGEAGRNASLGAIYTTLERMDAKGLVRGRLGDPLPERGGRARRYYKVTSEGRKALSRSLAVVDRLRQGAPRFA
jgi:PadR family transcriptional regulator PadR